MADQGSRNSVPGLELLGILGSGSFGVVYLVKNESGEEFALKSLNLDPDRSSKPKQGDPEAERDLLRSLSHEHVLAYVDSYVVECFLCVVTEYCQGGDIERFLGNSGRPVPEDLLTCWLHQMALGLEYMHTHDPVVLHRDLKPSNIYLTERGDIRLGDLGIARKLEKASDLATTVCGTPSYISPEQLQYIPYCAKTDIWSLGCCVVMMATLKKPFDESSLYKLIHAIVYTDRKPLPIAYSRGFDHLIGQMLEKDPRLRSSASQLLEHLLLLKESSAIEQKPLDLLARHDLLRILKQPQKVKKLLSEEEQREFSTLTMNLSIIRNTPRDQTDGAHARVKTGKSRERGESGGGSTTRAKRTSEVGDDDEEITLRSFASWGETFVDRGETANSQKTITSSIASSTAHSMSFDESTFIDRGTMRPVSDAVTSLPLSLSMIHFEESLLDPETKPRQQKTLKSRENSSASLSFPEQDPARSAQHQKIKSSGKSPLTVSKSSEEALYHNRTKSARRQAKLPLKMTKSTVEESDNGATKSAYHQSMESPLAFPNTADSSLYHYRENSAQHRTVTPSETSSKLLSSTSCRDTVDSGETKPSMTSSLPATLQKPSRLSILVSTIGAPSKTTGVSESDDHISTRVGSSLDVQMENLKKSLKRALSQSPSLDHDAIVDLLTASQNPYTALAQLMELLDETEY